MTVICALESCVIVCPEIMCRGLGQNGSVPEIKTTMFHVGNLLSMEVWEVIVYFVLKLLPHACWETYALDLHYLIISVSCMFNNTSLSNLWQL
jgi:hypothetical protein